MGREEVRGGDSEGVRREKKQREEKKWESLLWERLNEWKKIFFPRSKEDRSYALCKREIVFHFFLFLGKQPIENKSYFYKSFSLTKNIFPLTNFFLYYQTLEMWKTIFIEGFPTKQAKRWIPLLKFKIISTLKSIH